MSGAGLDGGRCVDEMPLSAAAIAAAAGRVRIVTLWPNDHAEGTDEVELHKVVGGTRTPR